MKQIGRLDLLDKSSEYIWTNCRICNSHFESTSFTSYKHNRLKADAIPNILPTKEYNQDKTVTIYREEQQDDESDSECEDDILFGTSEIPRRDDLTTVCRGCMSSSKKHLTILLEDTTMQMFNQCTRLNASYGDGLPNAICDACLNSCRLWSDFYAQCQHSDLQLRTEYGLTIPEKNNKPKSRVAESLESIKGDVDGTPSMTMDSFVCNTCDETIYGDQYLTHVCSVAAENKDVKKGECDINPVEELIDTDSYSDSNLDEEKFDDKFQEDFSDDDIDLSDSCDGDDDPDYDYAIKESVNNINGKKRSHAEIYNDDISSISSNDEDEDNENDNLDSIKRKRKIYNCMKCPLRFTKVTNFKNHFKFHKLVPEIKCQKCGETFETTAHLSKHCKIKHPGETIANYLCTECNKKCLTYSLLRMHLNSHDNVGIMCTKCGRMLSTRAALKGHNARKHSGREGTYKCGECHKLFDTITELRYHGKSVHTERAFSCTFCSKSFKTPYTLRVHILTHLDKKHCEKCQRGFKMEDALIRHMEKCTGPGKKKSIRLPPRIDCGICKMPFDGGRELEAHLIHVHANEVDDIRREIDKHKTKECLECGKRFFYFALLRMHQIKSHGKVDFKCDHCDKSFRSATSLISHTARKHPEKVPAPQALLDKCKELESGKAHSW